MGEVTKTINLMDEIQKKLLDNKVKEKDMQMGERTVKALVDFLFEMRDELKKSKLYFLSRKMKYVADELDKCAEDIEYKLLGVIKNE